MNEIHAMTEIPIAITLMLVANKEERKDNDTARKRQKWEKDNFIIHISSVISSYTDLVLNERDRAR